MHGKDWKHIKGIVELFTQGKSSLDDDEIIPIAAYAPDFPVKLRKGQAALEDVESSELLNREYSHLSTLIEKSGRYEVGQKTFLITNEGEAEILYNKETFAKDEIKELVQYFNVTKSHFNKCPHIRIIKFTGSKMKRHEFNDIIELWRTQPPQT